MSYYTNYIGYKQTGRQIGFGETTLATGGAAAPVTLIVDAAIALLPVLIPWVRNMFRAPARDSRKLIDALKPQIINVTPRDRLGLVIATGQKIDVAAKDVEARELLLWYRQSYPNDYQSLLTDDKIFFNNYILSIRNTRGDGNNMYANLDKAMFTNAEINYNANPLQTASNVLSNFTKSPSTLILYAGIGLGLLLLLKK